LVAYRRLSWFLPAATLIWPKAATPVFALSAAEAREVLRDEALRLEPGKIYLPEGSPAGAAAVSGNAGLLGVAVLID
jgi:putative ABC transport system permease protein